MQRYAQLHARAHSVAQLGNVIAAMRGVAAARAQQGRQQLENARKYADIVADAISQVLTISAAKPATYDDQVSGSALVVFCAEHGFAGTFSEKLLADACAEIAAPVLLLIGSRGVHLARARGLTPVWSAKLVSQLSNAATLADRICVELYRHLHAGRINRVDVIYARPQASHGFTVVHQQLLPLDFTRFALKSTALPPILNLSTEVLLERLAGEYLFAQLNEAIVHSFAAENLERLRIMTAARENIKRRMETLTSEERQARQSEITAEIIELAAGADVERINKLNSN